MDPVELDARAAELAYLDVLDILPDGTLSLNEEFRQACLKEYEAGRSPLDEVFPRMILERAAERGIAGCLDLEGLALTALEIAVADAERREAAQES